MDQKTLIRLAQPLATTLLAISIATFPLIAKAVSVTAIEGTYRSRSWPIYVKILQ